MEDKIKAIFNKIVDVCFKITKKFDGISQKINERTGMNINVGMIVLGAGLAIVLFIFVKEILGFLWSLL